MNYRNLGKTGMKISEISVGTLEENDLSREQREKFQIFTVA